MVGRGGRSRRCGTCKRRKVKCDETRPHCERCQRAGLPCQGYDIHAMFVNETARLDVRNKECPAASKRSHALTHCSPPRKSIRCIFPTEEDVSVSHLLHCFTPSDIRSSMPTATVLPRLIAADEPHASALHKRCLYALAASFFGKMERNKTMYEKGQWLYVDALAQLGQRLASVGEELDSGTLRAIICLVLYENINVTDPTAWFKHYDGLSKLILLRGPTQYQDGVERDLLQTCRFMIILRAGILRVPCFLAQPSWRLVAWPSGAEADCSSDVLMNIFAEVPGIVHDLEDLRKHGDPPTDQVFALRCRTQKVLEELQTWRDARQCHPLPSGKADCFALALHHSILLCLAEPSRALFLPLSVETSEESSDCAGSPVVDSSTAEGDLARDICVLANLILQNRGSTALAFLLIFPLQMASQHLVPGSPQAYQVEHIMNEVVANNFGLELGRKRDWTETFAKSPYGP